MVVHVPHPEGGMSEHDQRLNGPQTVQGRLREWSRVRHWPALNVWPPESAMYAVLHNPGRTTTGKSDGGMAAYCDAQGAGVAAFTRAREVGEAVSGLPATLRDAIESVYLVEARERTRTVRAAAELLGIPTMTLYDRMAKAERIIACAICLDTAHPYTVGSGVTVLEVAP